MPTAKLLTEEQMWRKIAHTWKTKAGKRKGGGWGIYIRRYPAIHSEYLYGLCNVLAMLSGQCAPSVYYAINVKIKRAVVKSTGDEWPYAWPTNEKGAKQRIAFCLKQAKLLKKGRICARTKKNKERRRRKSLHQTAKYAIVYLSKKELTILKTAANILIDKSRQEQALRKQVRELKVKPKRPKRMVTAWALTWAIGNQSFATKSAAYWPVFRTLNLAREAAKLYIVQVKIIKVSLREV